ncbi:phage major capsid protein [Halosquirtibacter laminarini]|uniref:Phage major capsid protein n=1 Tax=Halosquirtibacter laminarini TaxID=3374600 RepID=A0AC61NI48_9BACT|nr:phage major capsid protein [Prolixibacteraceae bacterium]
MRTSQAIKKEITDLRATLQPLAKRVAELNDDEKKQFDDGTVQLKALNEELQRTEQAEDIIRAAAGASTQTISTQDDNDLRSYSFARALRIAAGDTPLDGIEREMDQEAKKEATAQGKSFNGVSIPHRILSQGRALPSQNTTEPGAGQELITEEAGSFLMELRNKMILSQLGATYLTGLQGDLPLIDGAGFEASWIDESKGIDAGKMKTTKRVLQPKMMACAGSISRKLLVQTNNVAEQIVRQNLTDAMAYGIQTAAFNGAGDKEPLGILNTDGIQAHSLGSNGDRLSWDDIVKLETLISQMNADIGNLAYITNAKVRGYLKTKLKADAVAGYIWDKNLVNGYNAHVTNSLPSNLSKGSGQNLSSMIFGNFADLYIGSWGGIDLISDPYTAASQNAIKLFIHSMHDITVRRKESFAVCKDIITL